MQPPENHPEEPLPEIAIPTEAEKLVTTCLIRLRQLPTSLRGQEGRTPLPELSRIILSHLFVTSPDVTNQPRRLMIEPASIDQLALSSSGLVRTQIMGTNPDEFHLTLQINMGMKELPDLGDEHVNALLIPHVAIAARFIQAANATFVDVFAARKDQKARKVSKDITYADRLYDVYLEAWDLQRKYMLWVNEQQGKPFFKNVPTPEKLTTEIKNTMFGPSYYPQYVPPIDFGVEDVRMAFEGPTDQEIRENPKAILQMVDLKHLRANPREQQRFLAAFAFYLAKQGQPDSIDEAVVRRVMRREGRFLQDDDIRLDYLRIWTNKPLLKFTFKRAAVFGSILELIATLSANEAQYLNLGVRQINPANFDRNDAVFYGIVGFAEHLLEDIAIVMQEDIG